MTDNKDEKAVAVVTPSSGGSLASVGADEFRIALEQDKMKRDMLTNYIKSELQEHVDYGIIPGTKKPTLLKPGAERILNLLGLQVMFVIDHEAHSFLPDHMKKQGAFCFVAKALNKNGDIVGEGRGMALIGDKATDRYAGTPPNMAIKMAQKCAQVDLALRIAGLSDRFTQDLEDMPPVDGEKPQYKPRAASAPSSTGDGITGPQLGKIQKYFRDKGLDYHPIIAKKGYKSLKELTKRDAMQFITKMLDGGFDDQIITLPEDDAIDLLEDDPFPTDK